MSVSIVVPVYNVAEYLEECFESIFAQSLEDFEVIAIDDGSTDESLKELQKVQEKHRALHIISQHNKGLGAARNVGLGVAKGEYVYFLDSDDMIMPNMLEKCVTAMEMFHCDVIGFQAEIFGDIEGRNPAQYIYDNRCNDMNRVIEGKDFFKKNHHRIPLLNTPLLFFRRSFLLAHNLFFLEGILHEDVEFFYRMINVCNSLLLMDKSLYLRRYRPNSIMTTLYSNKREYNLVYVYTSIMNIMCDVDMRKLFMYDALKGIRKSYENIKKNGMERIPVCDAEVLNIYSSIYEEVLSSNFLTKCEFFLGYRQLVECIEDEKLNVELLRKDLCISIQKSGLYSDCGKVGIYGTGGTTDVFLKACNAVMGRMPENVVYIDSVARTDSRTFWGHPITNYLDVKYDELESVIVSSELYEDELANNVMSCNCRIPVFRITRDLEENVL